MNETSKKLFLLGLGLASYTEEKAKEFLNELLIRGEKYNESDSKLAEFLKSADKSAQEFEQKIEELISEIVKKLNLATKQDIEELKKEIEALKNRGSISDKN
jgi:polyhydroxyalkanoate synthesis regulator phasin